MGANLLANDRLQGGRSQAIPTATPTPAAELRRAAATADQYIKAPVGTPKKSSDPSSAQLLKYQIWPAAGAPIVSQEQDVRLATTGVGPRLLTWLDTKVPLVSKLIRTGTRVSGPPMYWVSGVANGLLLLHDWNNPAFKPGTKAALVAGTGFTFAGAATATWSALPLKGALFANRLSGFFGGVAGGVFGALNMLVTLKNKDATPVEKVSATSGFALGTLSTILGTAAVFLPAGTALGPLGLATWATIVGAISTATCVTQLLFAHNKWMNKELAGAGKAIGTAAHDVEGWGHKLLSWL